VDPDKNEESRGLLEGVNYKTGNLLASRVFGGDARYDIQVPMPSPFQSLGRDFNEKWNS